MWSHISTEIKSPTNQMLLYKTHVNQWYGMSTNARDFFFEISTDNPKKAILELQIEKMCSWGPKPFFFHSSMTIHRDCSNMHWNICFYFRLHPFRTYPCIGTVMSHSKDRLNTMNLLVTWSFVCFPSSYVSGL